MHAYVCPGDVGSYALKPTGHSFAMLSMDKKSDIWLPNVRGVEKASEKQLGEEGQRPNTMGSFRPFPPKEKRKMTEALNMGKVALGERQPQIRALTTR